MRRCRVSARSILSVGEVVSALVASRLCSPSPLYDVAGWASEAAVHELLEVPTALLGLRESSLLCQGRVAICGFLSVSPLGGVGYE